MFDTFRSSITRFLVEVVLALFSVFVQTSGRWRSAIVLQVYDRYRAARDWVLDFIVAPIRSVLARFAPWVMSLPSVKLMAARLYVMRQVRRDHPRLEQQWRMCPSG